MEAASPLYRNDLEIQFFGLRRSGNHGVIAWIAQQYAEPITFLNNVPVFEDPFSTFKLGRMPNAVPERRLAPGATEALRATQKKLLLISYEDLKLLALDGVDILPARVQSLGESRLRRRVLLLRDFHNWFASRMRLAEKRSNNGADPAKRTQRLVGAWLTYAREFLGETAYLGAEGLERVSYNRWFDDDAYAAAMLESLNIPVTNLPRTIVPETGGGSSFDDSIAVLERWKYLLGDKYRDVRNELKNFRDDIEAYNQKIFDLKSPF